MRIGDKYRTLKWLMYNGHISQNEATQGFGCTRLASIINRLRNEGHDIETEIVHGTDRHGDPSNYGVYWLREVNPNGKTYLQIKELKKGV